MVRLTIENYVSAHSPGRLLYTIYRRMVGWANLRFADADLSFTQWLSLKFIHEGSVRSASELARELDMTSGAATRLLDVLEHKGFVRRRRSDPDRRVVRLTLTPNGMAKVLELAPILVDAWNEILASFDQTEYTRLEAALIKLLGIFDRNGCALKADVLLPPKA